MTLSLDHSNQQVHIHCNQWPTLINPLLSQVPLSLLQSFVPQLLETDVCIHNLHLLISPCFYFLVFNVSGSSWPWLNNSTKLVRKNNSLCLPRTSVLPASEATTVITCISSLLLISSVSLGEFCHLLPQPPYLEDTHNHRVNI